MPDRSGSLQATDLGLRPGAFGLSRAAYALSGAAADAYLAAELATTPPRRIQAALHDAVVHTCRQAADALGCGELDVAAERLRRARAVVLHLQAALRPGGSGDSRRELADLYRHVHARLVEAGEYRKREAVDEAVRLLERGRAVLSAVAEAATAAGDAAEPVQCGEWLG